MDDHKQAIADKFIGHKDGVEGLQDNPKKSLLCSKKSAAGLLLLVLAGILSFIHQKGGNIQTPQGLFLLDQGEENVINLRQVSFNGKYSIKSYFYNEYLYCGGPALDGSRRRVLSWVPGFSSNPSAFCFEFENHGSYVKIKHCNLDRWLYVGGPSLDDKRRYMLAWMDDKDRTTEHYQWKIYSYTKHGQTLYGIKSVKFGEYLYTGVPKLDADRRHVLTWKGSETPPSDDKMLFYIKSY